MSNPIGIMLRRLLPKFCGCYQDHPEGCWQNEFPNPQKLGLNCIGVILGLNDLLRNLLTAHVGLEKIKGAVVQTDVEMQSVCETASYKLRYTH